MRTDDLFKNQNIIDYYSNIFDLNILNRQKLSHFDTSVFNKNIYPDIAITDLIKLDYAYQGNVFLLRFVPIRIAQIVRTVVIEHLKDI